MLLLLLPPSLEVWLWGQWPPRQAGESCVAPHSGCLAACRRRLLRLLATLAAIIDLDCMAVVPLFLPPGVSGSKTALHGSVAADSDFDVLLHSPSDLAAI